MRAKMFYVRFLRLCMSFRFAYPLLSHLPRRTHFVRLKTTMALTTSPERASELLECLAEIKARVQRASTSSLSSPNTPNPTLIAVSKYKPPSDILACFENGQIDFGENYVQELVDKAEQVSGIHSFSSSHPTAQL